MMRLSHELRVGASQGIGAGAYGVRMNMLIPGDLPAEDPRMADAGRAERLGSLSLYNDALGALTWTEADNPMPAYADRIKRICSVQSRMRRCVVGTNLSVRYLDPNDSTKYTDGSDYAEADGNIMVQIPKFWFKVVSTGDWIEMWISPSPAFGYAVHPAFSKIINGVVTQVNYRYVGAYEGVLMKSGQPVHRYDWVAGDVGDRNVSQFNNYASGDSLASVPGYLPCSSMNIAQFREAARAIDNNTDDSTWRQLDAYLHHAIQLLMVVEYATWNSQTALTGNANKGLSSIAGGQWLSIVAGNSTDQYYPIVPTGLTNSLGNRSGSVNLANVYSIPLPTENIIGVLPDAPAGWIKDGSKYSHVAGVDEKLEYTGFVPTKGVVYRVKLRCTVVQGTVKASFGGESLVLSPGVHKSFYVEARAIEGLVIAPSRDYVGDINNVSIVRDSGLEWDDVVPSYRGIESYFGHIFKWIDGVLLDFASTSTVSVYAKNGQFSGSIADHNLLAGAQAAPASGYIHKLNFLLSACGFFYPAATGGTASQTIGVDDRYYNTSSAGLRVVAVGGAAFNGGSAGAFCVAAYYGVSTSITYFGGRLCL